MEKNPFCWPFFTSFSILADGHRNALSAGPSLRDRQGAPRPRDLTPGSAQRNLSSSDAAEMTSNASKRVRVSSEQEPAGRFFSQNLTTA